MISYYLQDKMQPTLSFASFSQNKDDVSVATTQLKSYKKDEMKLIVKIESNLNLTWSLDSTACNEQHESSFKSRWKSMNSCSENIDGQYRTTPEGETTTHAADTSVGKTLTRLAWSCFKPPVGRVSSTHFPILGKNKENWLIEINRVKKVISWY